MELLRHLKRTAARFRGDERGAVLAEALVVVPFVTLFSVGILEFGNMFWQKEQIETGLRDAARYLARCQTDVAFAAACNQTVARRIAYRGTSDATSTAQRVPGWGPGDADIVITTPVAGVIRVATSFDYGVFFAGWLGFEAVTIEAFHEERYIGW